MRYRLLLSLALILFPALHAAGQDAPLPPREAPLRMTVPDGFRVTLFAGEPDVVQPIAMCFDHRGRLWVAECYSYPKLHKDPKEGRDRILIFEDTDGDGVFDKRTVFHDKIANISGIQVGFGGVFVCATPHLLFIPDKNGDDVPDGPAEVLLDGWDIKAGHNVMSSLTWGPDGWLYGCHGILVTAKVGKPGTPDDKRTPMNCSVWRYHPTRKTFEVVAHGTTNPWGLDFDEHGQIFITNCVIDHLWHVVPGGHYERMYGQDLNPNVYGLMKSICDHSHWGGGHWTTSRGGKGVHSEAGGGHAHTGCLIYQGDNFPERYRGTVFMCNLHGNRINNDILERKGSSYVARHGKDFLHANDPWFRGLALCTGPDGAIYVSDWCDTGECHNYEVAHKKSGRIYKIMYGKIRHQPKDLSRLSNEDLLELHFHKNDWYVRQARRLLQERATQKKLEKWALFEWMGRRRQKPLPESAQEAKLVHRRLDWTCHATSFFDQRMYAAMLFFNTVKEDSKSWTLARYFDSPVIGEVVKDPLMNKALVAGARSEPSARIRLSLASGIQRLPPEERWELVEALLSQPVDPADPTLAMMLWYAVEPLPGVDLQKAVGLLRKTKVPIVREFLTRRIASWPEKEKAFRGMGLVLAAARAEADPEVHRDVLRGIQSALGGARAAEMPVEWNDAYLVFTASKLLEVKDRSLALAVQFGDKCALETLRKIVSDSKEPAAKRQAGLGTLLFHQSKDLVPLLHDLLADASLRGHAIKGLAAFDDPKTPALILESYKSLSDEEKADAVHTLASRPAFALALLGAVGKNQVPRGDLSAFTIRQLQALKNKEVTDQVAKVWGTLRPASAEKAKLLTKYKAALTPAFVTKANLSRGRFLYAKTCASCHRLFGDGGDIGPDLTGSQRMNLDYLLENMLDPSAIVAKDYQVTILTTSSGRVLTGIIKQETDKALTVQTQNEIVILPKDEIESRVRSPLSMMPEGQLDSLTLEEVRDLVAYLSSPMQVPLPPNK